MPRPVPTKKPKPIYDAECGKCMKPETREAYEAQLGIKRHTNLTNEITGSYYEPDSIFDSFDKRVAIGVVVMIVLTGVIYWLG